MEKLTKKQKIFLIIYPFLHCLSTLLFFTMTLATGQDGCPETDPPITWYGEVISTIGNFFACILLAPVFLLEKAGVKLHAYPPPAYIPYLYIIFLTGIWYGYIMVYTYKFLRKK